MSTQNKRLKTHSFTDKGFASIDRERPKHCAADICNFRISSDGSIEKRHGFKKIAELPGTPSYFGIFNIGSSELGIAVIGDQLFNVDLDSGEYTEYYGTLDAPCESCSIVFHKDNMLIFDGNRTKLLSNRCIEDFEGYAPLLGKAWHPLAGGGVNESINLVSSRYRINYALSASTASIRLPSNVISIDHAELNGEPIYEGEYNFNYSTKYVTSDLFSIEGGSVTFWVTYDRSSYMEAYKCTCAVSVSVGNDSVIFCYGRSDLASIFCYRSSPLTDEMLLDSSRVYSDTMDIYIPIGHSFSVGSMNAPIRSVLPYNDNAIIFSDNGAWLVPLISDTPSLTLLNRSVGCSSPYASGYFKDTPVSVCRNRLFVWSPTLDPNDPLNAVCVSRPIKIPAASSSDRIALLENHYENELWIFEKGKDNIFVYDYENGQWIRFSGFSPDFAFSYKSSVGFIEGSSVYLFDEEAEADTRDGKTAENISATYSSAWTKIDPTGKNKHADRLIAEAFLGSEGNASVTLKYNGGDSETIPFSAVGGSDSPQIFVTRLPHTRFREVSFTLNADGASRERFYDVALEFTADDGNQY